MLSSSDNESLPSSSDNESSIIIPNSTTKSSRLNNIISHCEFKKRDELDDNDLDIDNIMLVCCRWMRHSQNIVNDIIDLIVKYAAFQVSYITEDVIKMAPFPKPMIFDEINELQIGNVLDVRDFIGRYCKSTIITCDNETKTIKIHYQGWTDKFDETIEIFKDENAKRLFKSTSVSKRKRHRLSWLKVGDFVDINPSTHYGWKSAEITQIEYGQLKVTYSVNGRTHAFWTHFDNINEIRPVDPQTHKYITLDFTRVEIEPATFIYNTTQHKESAASQIEKNVYYIGGKAPLKDEFDYAIHWMKPIKLIGIYRSSTRSTKIIACTAAFAKKNIIPESRTIQLNDTWCGDKEYDGKFIDDIFDKAKAEPPTYMILRANDEVKEQWIHIQVDICVKDRNKRFRFDLFDAKKMETLFKDKFGCNAYGFYGNKRCQETKNIGTSVFMIRKMKLNYSTINCIQSEMKKICKDSYTSVYQYPGPIGPRLGPYHPAMTNVWKEQFVSLDGLVYLVKGIDDGRNAWYYVLVDCDKLDPFLKALNDDIIHLENYGYVLTSKYGDEPSSEIRDELKAQWLIS